MLLTKGLLVVVEMVLPANTVVEVKTPSIGFIGRGPGLVVVRLNLLTTSSVLFTRRLGGDTTLLFKFVGATASPVELVLRLNRDPTPLPIVLIPLLILAWIDSIRFVLSQ